MNTLQGANTWETRWKESLFRPALRSAPAILARIQSPVLKGSSRERRYQARLRRTQVRSGRVLACLDPPLPRQNKRNRFDGGPYRAQLVVASRSLIEILQSHVEHQ